VLQKEAAKLVNVHIHQFRPGGAVVDAAALAQFQQQWATYRKLVESDCLAHREVGGIFRETLKDVSRRLSASSTLLAVMPAL
jgi:hypothetical protein